MTPLPGFEAAAAERAAVEAQRAREAEIPRADLPLFGDRTEEALARETEQRDRRAFHHAQPSLF
jgi:hypothetical protein